LSDYRENLRWIAEELSPSVTVSLMSQYYPSHKAAKFPLISRGINYTEYRAALDALEEFGLENGFTQQMDAPENYQPHLKEEGHPFH